MPDLELQTDAGDVSSLYALLRDGHWVSLRVADGARRDWALPGANLRTALLPPAVAQRLGAGSVLLVRPDGHVAAAA